MNADPAASTSPRLLLVYHADGGRWQALRDAAHKLVSPDTYPCTLCTLTHGVVRERSAWRAFRARHGTTVAIWHRDEFAAAFPDQPIRTPCVMARASDGMMHEVLSPAAIAAISDVDGLIARLAVLLG